MTPIEAIEQALEREPDAARAAAEAGRLLGLAERVLEAWVEAQAARPTSETREGFRLLALHHQGTRGVPSFNACRETCREIAWHYNLLTGERAGDAAGTLAMMRLLVRHLALFVGGKMESARLGEFCCASKPLRAPSAIIADE
jgi:hypothetical protein